MEHANKMGRKRKLVIFVISDSGWSVHPAHEEAFFPVLRKDPGKDSQKPGKPPVAELSPTRALCPWSGNPTKEIGSRDTARSGTLAP